MLPNIIYDIIYDIMDRKKLLKLSRKLDGFRKRGGIKAKKLEGLAKAVGRKEHKRGKEPTWVSAVLPNRVPISIPSHGSKDLNRFTARKILDELEEDIDQLEKQLGQEEGEKSNDQIH